MKPRSPLTPCASLALLALASAAASQTKIHDGFVRAMSEDGTLFMGLSDPFNLGDVKVYDRATGTSVTIAKNAIGRGLANGRTALVELPDGTNAVVRPDLTQVVVGRAGVPAVAAGAPSAAQSGMDAKSGVTVAINLLDNFYLQNYLFNPDGTTVDIEPHNGTLYLTNAGGIQYGIQDTGVSVARVGGDYIELPAPEPAENLQVDVHGGMFASASYGLSPRTLVTFALLPPGGALSRTWTGLGDLIGFGDMYDEYGVAAFTGGTYLLNALTGDAEKLLVPDLDFVGGFVRGKNAFGVYSEVIDNESVYSFWSLPQAVPEPAPMAALGLAATVILRRRRRA